MSLFTAAGSWVLDLYDALTHGRKPYTCARPFFVVVAYAPRLKRRSPPAADAARYPGAASSLSASLSRCHLPGRWSARPARRPRTSRGARTARVSA